jgi:hypothetical protein
MPALFELAVQYREDVSKLEDLDLDEQTVADTLEAMGGELEAKAVNVIYFAQNLAATAAAIKEAETKMAARRKALENRAEALKKYVFDNMKFAGISKIECPHFKLSIRDNPASVDVFDQAQLPADYLREVPATYTPDKTLIGKALKDGFDVPGAKLVHEQRLDIK